jgi:hypothetical protein
MKRTRNLLAVGLTFGLVVALQSGCAGTTAVTQPAAQAAPEQADKSAGREIPPLAGKVVETMNAGSYTYISLEKDGKKGWIAVPVTEVAVGQEVQVKPGTEMGPFSSKTLKRSFDNIIFSPGLVTEAKNQATQGQPGAEAATTLPPGHPVAGNKAKPKKGMDAMFGSAGGEMAENLSGKVVETMDAGGYTYINLEKDGRQTWAAVPTMKVTVGEEMELQSGAVMTNFTSKSMNKTFDRVVFSGGPLHSK